MEDQLFFSIIETLYRAALEPGAWIAFIEEFSKLINADGGHYYLFDHSLQGITFGTVSSAYSPDVQRQHAEHWQGKDMLFKRSLVRGGEWLLNDREFDRHYLSKDSYHNEFLFQYDIYHVAGYRTDGPSPISSAIGFLWGKNKKTVGDAELTWLKRLQPHFELAGHLHREMMGLKLSAGMQDQVLMRFKYPILIVYEGGIIAFLNKAAEQWLERNRVIGVKSQRLTAFDSTVKARMERLLFNAHCGHTSGICPVPRQGGGKAYQMMIQPLNPLSPLGSLWQRPLALIVVADPLAQPPLPAEWLFGLTAAEARVVVALAEGKTLEEIAKQGNVTANTVRTQLKQAMSKTDSRRQTELIRTVTALSQFNLLTEDK